MKILETSVYKTGKPTKTKIESVSLSPEEFTILIEASGDSSGSYRRNKGLNESIFRELRAISQEAGIIEQHKY